MSERTYLVTGASSGIGLETARRLAATGARVLLVCRDRARGEAARAEIARARRGSVVDLYTVDLRSQTAIRAAARRILDTHERLDVLVNNAGVITRTRTVTEDGIETQLAVNHLAPFLLTSLLLPILRASAPARVVTVASAVEALGRIDFDDLGRERRYDANEAYCQSKLANVMFTYALARRLEGTGVTANCLHPGAIRTKLLGDYYGGPGPVSYLKQMRFPGPEAGAESVVHAATSPELDSVNGCYFVDRRPAESSPAARDVGDQERLWSMSDALTRTSAD